MNWVHPANNDFLLVSQFGASGALYTWKNLSPLQGNGPYYRRPSLRTRAILQRILGLGRSRNLWRVEPLVFVLLAFEGP
jgi:hypothetical protein